MSDWINTYDDEEEEVYLIDSNDRVLQRIVEYEEKQKDKLRRINREKIESFFAELEYDEEGNPVVPVDEEGYAILPLDENGDPLVLLDEDGKLIIASPREEPDDSDEGEFGEDGEETEEEPDVSPMVEEILENARAEAEAILEEARSQADAMFEHSRAEGNKQGYNEGLTQAYEEYANKNAALEEERKALYARLETERDEMEKNLVEVICDVVDKAFGAGFSDCSDIILHLVDQTLLNADNSRVFIIRVSEKNREFLLENKQKLLDRVGSDCTLDIIADPTMGDEKCMIETDGGIFDCGIDVELNGLIRDLRMLG